MATFAEIAERQAARSEERLRRKMIKDGLDPDASDADEQQRRAQHEDDQGGQDDDDLIDDQGGDEGDEGDEGRRQQDDGDDGEDLRQQVRALTQQLNAMQGRVAPAQQDLEDLRRVASSQRQQLDTQRSSYEQQIAELREQLNKRQLEDIDPAEFLTEDERAEIDPVTLRALAKMAGGLAQKMAPKVDVRGEVLRAQQEQEQNRIKNHRQTVLNDPKYGLQKLTALANDPRFLAWAQKDDNEVDSAVNSLLHATSTEEIDRYARILQRKLTRYQEEQKDPASRRNNPASPRNTLAAGMRRSAGKKLTEAEVREQLSKANQLARSRNPADREAARKILDSLPA